MSFHIFIVYTTLSYCLLSFLSIYPKKIFYLSVYLPSLIYKPLYSFLFIPVHLSICLSLNLSMYRFAYWLIHLPTRLSLYLCVYSFIGPYLSATVLGRLTKKFLFHESVYLCRILVTYWFFWSTIYFSTLFLIYYFYQFRWSGCSPTHVSTLLSRRFSIYSPTNSLVSYLSVIRLFSCSSTNTYI